MSTSLHCRRLCLGLLALATSACALTGYDFGNYERAAVTSQAGSSGASSTGGQSGGTEAGPSPFGVGLSAGGDQTDDGGAGGLATEGGAGGLATEGGAGGLATEGGAGGLATEGGAGGHATAACEPQSCFALGLECGQTPSGGCGQPLDCGGCFWWFQECRQNHCVIVE